ncbi:uncharacterized protein BDZ99DRAFT_532560 [Mytilinidion resinicola]|uniref:Uncharacterized protein n=1 Tax=Mytilinidion resinicola TaxID=574789 RepID=A0A6A6YPB9_9PEZI|nr:uncharacterized protein BDZ99DRAFT_532560 [Mytilinidion resinicola]KAF2809825.1 hypothetical protein BDZ99DRAFT_532560 [Mytilinidion resinicola]
MVANRSSNSNKRAASKGSQQKSKRKGHDLDKTYRARVSKNTNAGDNTNTSPPRRNHVRAVRQPKAPFSVFEKFKILPPELREIVYYHALDLDQNSTIRSPTEATTTAPGDFGLLQADRQLHHEASAVLERHATAEIDLSINDDRSEWLQDLLPRRARDPQYEPMDPSDEYKRIEAQRDLNEKKLANFRRAHFRAGRGDRDLGLFRMHTGPYVDELHDYIEFWVANAEHDRTRLATLDLGRLLHRAAEYDTNPKSTHIRNGNKRLERIRRDTTEKVWRIFELMASDRNCEWTITCYPWAPDNIYMLMGDTVFDDLLTKCTALGFTFRPNTSGEREAYDDERQS